MKIGLVCPYNLFGGSGVGEVVLALRDGINKKGHQAVIVTPQPYNFKGSVPEGIVLVGGARPVRAVRTSSQVSASIDLPALSKMMQEQAFDILNFHEPWSPMLSLQMLTRSKAVNIGTFHAAMSERRTSRTVERVITPYTKSMLKYLDALTAVSPTATKYASTLTRMPIHIIPNGIDLTKYTEQEQIDKPKTSLRTILYVGRLEKRKGVRHLLQAFALLAENNPNFRLMLAGDGPDRAKLEAFVHENRIRGVTFLGYVDEAMKRKLFATSDLFCSPAMYGESFGIVLLEAMASGCVVVAGNNSGYEGVLRDRGQLSIINPVDTPEFARRLHILTLDEDIRRIWREWAIEEVKQYDYGHIVDQYVSLYEEAYAKKTKS